MIKYKLKNLPVDPGVYIFKDCNNEIIYVGKASNIRKRVLQYFRSNSFYSPKIQQIKNSVEDIEFIIAESEQQALILECDLIKKFKPRFNIRLKDDKAYPYIKVDIVDDWPRVYLTRRVIKDGNRYFGPFTNARDVRKTLNVIEKIFPFRNCKRFFKKSNNQPCLQYHIGRCIAPCTGNVSKEEYRDMISKIIAFLEGKHEPILRNLQDKMNEYSNDLQFEKAIVLRDNIKSIENVVSMQKAIFYVRGDRDIIACKRNDNVAYAELFIIRNNKLIGRNSLLLEAVQYETPKQIIASLIKQYYSISSDIPPEIILEHSVEDAKTICNWLTNLRGKRVKLTVPSRGFKKKLVDLVANNVRIKMQSHIQRNISYTKTDYFNIATKLKAVLDLKILPNVIEGYDISNIQGNYAVGSIVTFEYGIPNKNKYRRFRIKFKQRIDDYAMIEEILRRRFFENSSDKNKEEIPDLVLIDGGIGHVNTAYKFFQKIELSDIQVIGISKKNEEIYKPNTSRPFILNKSGEHLHLLQRVRDEAHRFAHNYHRNVHNKNVFDSTIERIPGIGPKRRISLLKNFASLDNIRNASIEDLIKVKGINKNLAVLIKKSI